MRQIVFILWAGLCCATVVSQEIKHLVPDGETVKVIGTLYSVDYDADPDTISETKNSIANVFDGSLSTFFSSWERSNTWVGLDLGSKHVITKVSYCPRKYYEYRTVLGLFEGANSPDFGDANVLFLITDTAQPSVMTEQTLINTRGYRYVRYVGPYNQRCNIAEIAFYGYESEGDDSRLWQTTGIPDVIIHTQDAQDVVSRETYLKGVVSFISDNGTKFYSDSLEIRGRGNASWSFPKKPYRLKLYNSTQALELPAKARNWTLINNYGDKTLLRNLLAFDISKRFEMPYTPACKPVNVYLNGDYKGCYQFCDHIDIRKNRVDIKEMDKDDLVGDNLTGGYLLNIDANYKTEELYFTSLYLDIPVVIKSPDFDAMLDANDPMRNYIITFFHRFETSLNDFDNNAFRKLYDVNTFVRYFLINELTANVDAFWSVYLYKQRNTDMLYTGPVWDFDLAFENDKRVYPVNSMNEWLYYSKGSFASSGTVYIYKRMIERLTTEIKETWHHYRFIKAIDETALLKTADNYADEIYASQKLNFMRWNILNRIVHQNFQALGSFDAEVDVVRNFIRERIQWIDKMTDYDVSSYHDFSNDTKMWTSEGTLHVALHKPDVVQVYSLAGQLINSSAVGVGNVSLPLPKGLYIVKVGSEVHKVAIR